MAGLSLSRVTRRSPGTRLRGQASTPAHPDAALKIALKHLTMVGLAVVAYVVVGVLEHVLIDWE